VPRDADSLRQRLAPPASRMLRSTIRRGRSAPRPWAMGIAGGAHGRAPSGDCGAGRVAVAGRDPRDHEGRRAHGGGEPVGGSERARVRARKGEPVDGSGHLLPARSGVLPSRAALGSCLAAAGRPSPPRLARQAPRSRLRLATTVACSLPRRTRDPGLPDASLHDPPRTIRATPVGHGDRRRRTRRAPSGDCGAGRVAVAGRDPVAHEGRRARDGA
jgi:hypothetical protein